MSGERQNAEPSKNPTDDDASQSSADDGTVRKSGRTQRPTEKGTEYQKTMKLKVFRQLLVKLLKDGESLLEDLIATDSKQVMASEMVGKWRHQYVILLQTNADMLPLMSEDEQENHKTKYENSLLELSVLKEQLESLAPVQEKYAPGERTASGPGSVASCRSRTSSSSRSTVKSKLCMMRIQEEQSVVETKARAVAFQERKQLEMEAQELKRKNQELKWRKEQHQLETELKVKQARTKVIDDMEKEIDSLNSGTVTEQTEQEASGTCNKNDPQVTAKVTVAVPQTTEGLHLKPHAASFGPGQGPSPAMVQLQPERDQMHSSQPLAVDHMWSRQPHAASFGPGQEPTPAMVQLQPERDQMHSSQPMAMDHMRSRLPPIEPGTFKGDHTTFHAWLKAFETYIEARCVSPIELLHYLGHYTAGEAKNCITGFLNMRSEEAYMHAKKRLMDRYGNEFVIANEYKRKLKTWPNVKPGDSKSMTELADFLEQCSVACNNASGLKMFDGPAEVDLILKKLPKYVSDGWRRVVDSYIYEPECGAAPQYPPFPRFVAFICKEARVSSAPVSVASRSDQDRKQGKDQYPRTQTSGRERNTQVLMTSTPTTPKPASQSNQRPPCVVCEQNHTVDHCATFAKMTLDRRQEIVRQYGLCRACLRRGHRWKDCKKRQRCSKCDRQHPTVLHDDSIQAAKAAMERKEETPPTTSTSLHVTSSGEDRPECTHSMLTPVYLFHKDHPTTRTKVYALLDPQSDACFVRESVLREIDVSGDDVLLELNTMNGQSLSRAELVKGLKLQSVSEDVEVELPETYSKEVIPVDRQLIPRQKTTAAWPHLQDVAERLPEYDEDAPIGLLIGINCPKAIKPLEVVTGEDHQPWAIRTNLGWSVVGCMGETTGNATCLFAAAADGARAVRHFAFRTQTRSLHPEQIARMLDANFESPTSAATKYSQEDKQFLEIMDSSMQQREDGNFEAPLPLRHRDVAFPNNESQAQVRLQGLKRRLQKDDTYRNAYVEFLRDMMEKGYAEVVPPSELTLNDGHVWYVPHHGVFHKKKNKLRVVFDCSTEYRGYCLNQELLQGPDASNNLTGILVRFRKGRIALTCDIKSMFNQVKVTPHDRNLLRFLWWPGGDIEQEPAIYRMTTHLFGATSSPACAIQALNQTADKFESVHGKEAADFVRRNFYVDDGICSTTDPESAISLLNSTKDMCAEGGFTLTKFASNSNEVLKAIPAHLRSEPLQEIQLINEKNHLLEQALGLTWDLCEDAFLISINLKERPLTRRGILSGISSVYDPLGLVSPVVLKGKLIMKDLCGKGTEWDDPVPENIINDWLDWKEDLQRLSDLRIQRCYGAAHSPATVDTRFELHHFSDASMSGYGACSYLRIIAANGEISSDLVMAKAKVTPKKAITVPRLELSAAVLATRISRFLEDQLDLPEVEHFYWCDSQVVLGYIRNQSRRYHVFVANRVQEITNVTSSKQWHYVPSEENPSDKASRGASAVELMNDEMWWHGPQCLTSSEELPLDDNSETVDPFDPEVKSVTPLLTKGTVVPQYASLIERLEYFPTWFAAKRAVANCLRFKRKLLKACARRRGIGYDGGSDDKASLTEQLTVQDLEEAEAVIIKALQEQAFKDELVLFTGRTTDKAENEENKSKNVMDRDELSSPMQEVQKRSSLRKLDPVVTSDGVLCVGGRIRRADLPREIVHPVILPKTGHITTLIIRQCHERTRHAGREMTLGEIRQQGYWILHGRSAVSSYIVRCVQCRRLRGPTGGQKMSDLPSERLEPTAPFTFCGVDCFGPFYIKERRSELKRWGIIFTCFASRAVHLETVNSMTTDAFLNAYRRFICRRGPVQRLYCDRGTNFVGGHGALKAAIKEMDEERIKSHLLKDNCDLVEYEFGVPHASHMGGVYERMIRCARSALTSLLVANGHQLDDELLRTLMCEAEEIINSRPISTSDMTNTNTLEPLTPSFLLTQKNRVVLPFPGRFASPDVFARRRWRRIQFLANMFWSRWRREVISALQERRKWTRAEPNVEVDDVVLMVEDDRPRSEWPLARVVATYPSGDNLVRKVRVQTNRSQYDRPVHRLVILIKQNSSARNE